MYESERNPRQLQRHPAHQRIYGDMPVKRLVDSIRDNGVLEHVLISPDNVIVSGALRVQAAIIVGIETIPVLVFEDIEDDHHHIELMIHSNIR